MAKPHDSHDPLHRAVKAARSALRPDAYDDIRRDLDAVFDDADPTAVATAVRRAQIKLATIATGAEFDPRRHRAISQALRELTPGAPVAPLTTRSR